MGAKDRLGLRKQVLPGHFRILVHRDRGDRAGVHWAHPDIVGGNGAIFEGEGHGQPFLANPADDLVQCLEPGSARHLILHLLETDRAVGGEDVVRGATAAARNPAFHHHSLKEGRQERQACRNVEDAAEGRFFHVGRRGRGVARIARIERFQDHVVAVRKEPEFDMAMLLCQFVIAFADFGPATLLDPFGKVKGGDDRDLDLGRNPEQPEREALCPIEVGVGVGIAPMRLAVGIDEPETAREGR